ncbi:MAG: RnfH family protein [Rhodoferax sp.]|nr:RnfH family protein [Rhodoferax sp.]MCF8209568.1 RnfH family protein [Rhodoferax sp.]
MESKPRLHVTLVYSPGPREVREAKLVLEPGASVAQALHTCGWLAGLSAQEINTLEIGVWGRKVELDHPLGQDDRLELYRPLKVDPKVARRERFVRQGSKSAGLFAKKRLGAKAGY